MQETCELGMSFRETAARRKRADPDRGSRLLRDLHHEIDGLRAIHAGTYHERRLFTCRQRRRERLHCVRVGSEFAADLAGFYPGGLMGPIVDRHGHKSRSAGRLHGHVISACDRRRDVFGPRRFDREFDIGTWKFRCPFRVEKRLQRQDAARLLARGNHQRRLIAMRGVDVAECVAEAGCGMKIDEAGVAGGLGVTIGHADDGGFLQAEYVIDIVRPVAQERQFRRAGIAEHLADSELPQQIKRRLFDADGFHVCFWLFTRQGELSPACPSPRRGALHRRLSGRIRRP